MERNPGTQDELESVQEDLKRNLTVVRHAMQKMAMSVAVLAFVSALTGLDIAERRGIARAVPLWVVVLALAAITGTCWAVQMVRYRRRYSAALKALRQATEFLALRREFGNGGKNGAPEQP